MRRSDAVPAEVELLQQISNKLDRVVAILAIQGKERDRQVEILALAGLDSPFIASVLGLTAGAVRNNEGWKRAKQPRSTGGAEVPASGAAMPVETAP